MKKVKIITANGEEHVFDKVVLATHSDTALQLRGDDSTEVRILLFNSMNCFYSHCKVPIYM